MEAPDHINNFGSRYRSSKCASKLSCELQPVEQRGGETVISGTNMFLVVITAIVCTRVRNMRAFHYGNEGANRKRGEMLASVVIYTDVLQFNILYYSYRGQAKGY